MPWPVNPIMNHAWGLGAFNAYNALSHRTLCGEKNIAFRADETCTSGMAVTCIRCLAELWRERAT